MVSPISRMMQIKDIPAIARLERQIFTDPWPEIAFLREVHETELSWPRVIMDPESGEAIAYLVAWFAADEAHLANIAVDPAWRRRGLAQQLLDDFVIEARRREARMVLLEVRRSNAVAQEFYTKNGFYRVSTRPRYYRDNGEDALVLVLPLSEAGRLPMQRGVS